MCRERLSGRAALKGNRRAKLVFGEGLGIDASQPRLDVLPDEILLGELGHRWNVGRHQRVLLSLNIEVGTHAVSNSLLGFGNLEKLFGSSQTSGTDRGV